MVKVYGRKSIIDSLTSIPITVDLSKITESKTYEFDVKLPDGVTKISDKKIKVKADITKIEKEEQQKTQASTEETPPPTEEPNVTDENTTTDKNTSTEESEDIDS